MNKLSSTSAIISWTGLGLALIILCLAWLRQARRLVTIKLALFDMYVVVQNALKMAKLGFIYIFTVWVDPIRASEIPIRAPLGQNWKKWDRACIVRSQSETMRRIVVFFYQNISSQTLTNLLKLVGVKTSADIEFIILFYSTRDQTLPVQIKIKINTNKGVFTCEILGQDNSEVATTRIRFDEITLEIFAGLIPITTLTDDQENTAN